MPMSRTTQSPTLLLTICRARFEIHRAFPANENFNAAQNSAIGAPLVLAPGENPLFEKLMPSFPRLCGCMSAQAKIGVINNSVHHVVDEQPEAVAELIERDPLYRDDCQSILRRHTKNLRRFSRRKCRSARSMALADHKVWPHTF